MRILDIVTKNLVDTNFEILPAEVVQASKKQILETLAATISGSTCSISDEINSLVELFKGWGGKEESTIIAFGGRVPAPSAAFLNGVLCVRRDFDDSQVRGLQIHLSRAIVPTAFAMAERQGEISGKAFLTAVALGHDLSFRIRRAVGHSVNSPFGMITNFFGATATASKLLGHNNEQAESALGLAFHQLSGAQSGPGTAGAGATVKGVNNGMAAQTGIISALLAERGFTPSSEFLEPENKNNLYQSFYQGYYSPSLLTSDLGKDFMGLYSSQKEFPCCHGQHSAIEATLNLTRENRIQPPDVAEVVLHLSPGDYNYLAFPVENKRNPQNIIETQFSLYWGVASAIVYGEVNIRNFSAEALCDPRVREMTEKISAIPEAELGIGQGFKPAIVDIKTRDNKVYSRRIDYPFGSPENPMSFADVAGKFRHCCQYSVNTIPEKNQDEVIQMVKEIEEVSDVGRIVRLLA